VTEVTGDLYIGTTIRIPVSDVSSLAPLSCLERVGGIFTLLENHQLDDLAGLEKLTFVEDLRISTNSGLQSLSGPEALSVEFLLVRANRSLTSLGDGIVAVGGYLAIQDNASLPQCEADLLASATGIACDCSGNAGIGTCN
jgi:hypothetical protein